MGPSVPRSTLTDSPLSTDRLWPSATRRTGGPCFTVSRVVPPSSATSTEKVDGCGEADAAGLVDAGRRARLGEHDAHYAGGLVVMKRGTATIRAAELVRALRSV